MKCEDYREMLGEELTQEQKKALEQHLAECEDCRAEAEMLRMLRDLPDEELPAGYHAELMERLRREERKIAPKKHFGWRQMSLIAATVLLVAAVGGVSGVLQMRQDTTETAIYAEAAADRAADVADTAAPAEDAKEDAGQAKIAESADTGTGERQKLAENQADTAARMLENQTAEAASQETASMAAAPPANMPMEKAEDAENAVRIYSGAPSDAVTMIDGYAPPRAVAVSAEEILSLQAEDAEQLRADVLDCIADYGGYEEASTEENAIFAVIPMENADAFRDALQEMGSLQQIQYADSPEGAAQRVFEVQIGGE